MTDKIYNNSGSGNYIGNINQNLYSGDYKQAFINLFK
jgi:hypothetical protein